MSGYCSRADLESLWTAAALLTAVDDDGDETISTAEETLISEAIARGAEQLNAVLEVRYALSDLIANRWCRDANAALAAWLLAARKAENPPATLSAIRQFYLTQLAQIAAGEAKVPGIPEHPESLPGVIDRYLGA